MKQLPAFKQAIPPHKVEDWHGYTLDQLRYRRAYVVARIELEKDQILNDIRQQRESFSPWLLLTHAGSALRYANWGILAFQAFKTIGRLFGRKKG